MYVGETQCSFGSIDVLFIYKILVRENILSKLDRIGIKLSLRVRRSNDEEENNRDCMNTMQIGVLIVFP